MSVKKYDKLIRDNIPRIIEKDGKIPDYYAASEKEYHTRLIDKIKEEISEYEQSHNLEELADIMEVLEALIKTHNCSFKTLVELKENKRQENGAFDKRYVLRKVSK